MQKIILLFLLSFTGTALSGQLCVIDDSQAEICLREPAKRIISLSPHITELIYFIGAEDQLIGVIEGSHFPEEANKKQKVGGYRAISIEKIISLEPDLVVAWPSGNSAAALARLQALGIKIYYSEPEGVSGIVENIKELAILAGKEESIQQAVSEINEKKSELKKHNQGKKTINAIILISGEPLMTLSKKHAVQEAFELCSAKNMFEDLPTIAPLVSKESVLAAKPEIIVSTFPVNDSSSWLIRAGFKGEPRPEFIQIEPDYLLLQTPRMLKGIEKFCTAVDGVRKKKAH